MRLACSPHKKALVAFATFVLALVLPSTALATWGTNCSLGEDDHCYGWANWVMSGGEKVLGLESYIDTEYMNVFEYASGAVVDDEEWAAFPSLYNGWVEEGQRAGYTGGGTNCCTLRWFTSAWLKSQKWYQNFSPWEEPGWTLNRYEMQAESTVGGAKERWCYVIGEGSAGCVGEVGTESTRVVVGMEAGSNGEPENGGHDETAVLHENLKWYNWNKAMLEDRQYDGEPTTHVCTSAWLPYAGDINFGTC
jgi:hypothetical protein